MSRAIKTLPELIIRLGGPSAAARLLGTKPQNVTNWRAAGYIPATYYLVHRQILEKADPALRVKPKIWGFGR